MGKKKTTKEPKTVLKKGPPPHPAEGINPNMMGSTNVGIPSAMEAVIEPPVLHWARRVNSMKLEVLKLQSHYDSLRAETAMIGGRLEGAKIELETARYRLDAVA